MRSTDARLPEGFRAYEPEELDQRPPGSVGKDGRLDATFSQGDDGITRLTHDYARAPFHLMGGLHHDDHLDELVSLYIQNPAGGVAQGDRFRLNVKAEENAYAHVTTQSATKVHRMERNYAQSCVDITAEEGAYLEFLPDPTILYRDSRYHQSVDIELEAGATVLFSEVVVPGRLAHDEAFEYDRYYSRIRARHKGRPVCTDTVSLCAETDGLERQGLLGEYTVFGSLYVFSANMDAADLSDRIHEELSGEDNVHAGVSTLPNDDSVVVRVLGNVAQDVTDAVYRAWDETRNAVLGVGAHEIRKY